MKILLGSHRFSPDIGGIETCSQDLASAFIEQGHKVTIVTQSVSQTPADDLGFHVLRKPSFKELYLAIKKCDVFFQNNISLRTIFPAIILRKPLVITVATWLAANDNRSSLLYKIKYNALRFAKKRIAISTAIADTMPPSSELIPNPYDARLFRLLEDFPRDRDMVFVGRLVSDKGVDLLLEAVALLTAKPTVTIIGSGPEEAKLKQMTKKLGIANQVDFSGRLQGEQLVKMLNQHRIMVVPSRWNEPFGIVALEGIACGCAVVASKGGGLPEAVGACGLTFTNNDLGALSEVIQRLLDHPDTIESLCKNAQEHLQHFAIDHIANEYIRIFEEAIG